MLSRLELLLYRDFLRISMGHIAAYSNPMERAFNLVFIPAIVWILFLMYATKIFPKGTRYLLMIGFTAFGIVYGLYDAWITFSQAWFILALIIPAFHFMLNHFINKAAIKNIASHYSYLSKKAHDEHAYMEAERMAWNRLMDTRREISRVEAMLNSARRSGDQEAVENYRKRLEELMKDEREYKLAYDKIRRRLV